jgi:ketosteroid isomerase-like protein
MIRTLRPLAVFLRLLPLACAISCAAGPGPAAANLEPNSGQVLIDLEHRWIDALAHRDVKALDAILADDFLDNAYNGKVFAKQEILARIAEGGPTFPSLRLEEIRVRFRGDVAIVTGVNVVQIPGPDPYRVRFTDVFHRKSGIWRAVSAQETPVASPEPPAPSAPHG